MSDYWTLDGMLNGGEKHKKDSKQKKLNKKEKKGKKKKDHEHKDVVVLNYGDFLRSDRTGLFKTTTTIDGDNIETYILKHDDFEFPVIALDSRSITYKDWLKEKITNLDSSMNVNKVLYNSRVTKIDIPNGLFKKMIRQSESN